MALGNCIIKQRSIPRSYNSLLLPRRLQGSFLREITRSGSKAGGHYFQIFHPPLITEGSLLIAVHGASDATHRVTGKGDHLGRCCLWPYNICCCCERLPLVHHILLHWEGSITVEGVGPLCDATCILFRIHPVHCLEYPRKSQCTFKVVQRKVMGQSLAKMAKRLWKLATSRRIRLYRSTLLQA